MPPTPAPRPSGGGCGASAATAETLFFAGPVRENAIRARGGGMPGALVVVAGLLAFAVAALGVLFGAIGRPSIGTGSATLGSATTPGDPIGIPVLAYPALMSLLLISVAIGAFGVVFAKRTLATIAVALVLLPSILFAGRPGASVRSASRTPALPVTLLIPIAVIGLRRLRARPALALPVTSMLAALSVGGSALAQITAFTQAGTSGGLPLFFGPGLETALTMLGILIAPAAILAGAGAVSFGRTVTGFLGRSIDRLTPGDGILTGITLALVLLALAMSVHDIAAAASPARWVLRVTCAAALILAAMRWWRWAARGVPVGADAVESGAATGGPTLALVLAAFTAPLTLLLVLATVVTTLTGDIALVEASNALATAMGHAWTGTLYAVCAGLSSRRRGHRQGPAGREPRLAGAGRCHARGPRDLESALRGAAVGRLRPDGYRPRRGHCDRRNARHRDVATALGPGRAGGLGCATSSPCPRCLCWSCTAASLPTPSLPCSASPASGLVLPPVWSGAS